MAIAREVLIGLLTTFIGFVIGFTWRMSRRQVTYWRARRFWRPFVSGNLKIVLARFREFDSWEPSGLVGVGGMQAAAELVAFFDDLGFRRLGSSLDIVYHEQLIGELYDANLVCIGGPDANKVTDRMLMRIKHTIELGDPDLHVVSMRDTMTDKIYSPKSELDDEGRKVITLDYGLLIKTSNPFNPQRSIMIVAGSFGYGTWAGIKLARSRHFLRAVSSSGGVTVECLYRTEVVEEVPQAPEIVLIRQISSDPDS